MSNAVWGLLSGMGAASPFDGGGLFTGVNLSANGGVRGSGGGGTCSSSASVSIPGGAGGNAFCEIWEYE